MPLTDTAIRNAKPKDKPYKLSDMLGLYLYITPSGSKLWRMKYRYDRKEKLLSLGAYPQVSLAAARKKRDEARELLAEGRDPGTQVQKSEPEIAPEPMGPTFEAVAKDWFSRKKVSLKKAYADRVWSRIENDLLPQIGHMPIGQIKAPTILSVLRKVESRGVFETARRVHNFAGQIFRYAVASGICEYDPTPPVLGALSHRPPVKHMPSLKEAELPAFLANLEAYDGDKLTRYALEMVIYTFVRTNEVRFARWDEFERLDGQEPLWRIPGERMKMSDPHLVPLSPQVVDLLKRIRSLGLESEYVFPRYTKSGVISQNTMIYALYRMGYKGRATVHGLRGTASTVLNENGFHPDWVERQLAHMEHDASRAAYNSAEWLPQRRKMMIWWANFIDSKREEGLALRGKAA